jgi:hypothetical protein
MIKKCTAGLCFAVLLGAVPFGAFAQSPAPMMAMPAMDVSSVDCSTAPAHMMAMMTPPSDAMMATKGADTDATYVAMMKMMVVHAAMLGKIEMKCGKNPKAMAMASHMDEQLHDQYLTVEAVQTGF